MSFSTWKIFAVRNQYAEQGAFPSLFDHLYDPDFVVVILYGLVEAFHHVLELVRVLVNFGRFRQVGQQRVLLLC